MGRKKGRRRSPYKLKLKKETLYSLASLALIIAGMLVIVSFAGQGFVLKQIQEFFQEKFGFATLLIPFLLISAGLMLTQTKLRFTKPNVFLGAVLLFLMILGLGKAGAVGTELFGNLAALVQPAGATILLVGIGAAGFLIMTESSLDDLFVRFTALFQQAGSAKNSLAKIKLTGKDQGFSIEERGIKIKGGRSEMSQNGDSKSKPAKGKEAGKENKGEDDKPMGLSTAVVANVPGSSEGIYTPPPLSLLHDTIGGEADRGDIKQNASVIERTLESFGIQARVVEVNLGPAVTQYALEIALGTKLSRITGLQNDLALALAAPTGQIRIEAPIPGRSMVGVEIPNRSPEMVTLKSMLTSKQLKQNKSKTAVGLGLNVSGEAVVADISKMPHILIAGATGSGKSVSVNAFLLQILFRASPEEVKFILVDPKRVELTGYNGIPHLLTPVIVDPEKVVAALEWAINEMEKRYKLFAEVGARNIKTYNEMTGFQSLPYLIIVIDELADVMLFAPNQVEDAITRLAQMARATGIHLILATQRPSVDVLTGLIKANIPSRIAFNVTTMVDSRVIIDTPGAEKLLGKGDMLYIPPEQAKPSRIQGTFVSDEEAKEVIDFIKQSGSAPTYAEEVTTKFAAKKISGPNGTMDDVDDMFENAVREVTAHDKASASLLQRRLSIGYARAARILDQLEQAGIVGPQDGSKPREVLIQNADSYFNQEASE